MWHNYTAQPSDEDKIQFPSPHSMPNPTTWNIRDLDWNFNQASISPRPPQQFFAAAPMPPSPVTPDAPTITRIKRKSLAAPQPPSKKFISERKMIEHLNGLHLSSDFTNHNISPTDFGKKEEPPINVYMSPADLEEKLRNAQRITVLKEVRNIKSDPLLPKPLLDRAAIPDYCSALVLWQPQSKILKIPEMAKNEEEKEKDEKVTANRVGASVETMDEEILDNNNSSDVDFNQFDSNTMDLDL